MVLPLVRVGAERSRSPGLRRCTGIDFKLGACTSEKDAAGITAQQQGQSLKGAAIILGSILSGGLLDALGGVTAVGDVADAAEDAGAAGDDFPAIKPGSAGGETADRPFPQSMRQAALDENPGTCVYCHMDTDSPQVDHAIPRAQGGNATIENAQTTCGWCNASKGVRDFPVNPPPGFEGEWPPIWWDLFGE
jgi:HNH endonuclease